MKWNNIVLPERVSFKELLEFAEWVGHKELFFEKENNTWDIPDDSSNEGRVFSAVLTENLYLEFCAETKREIIDFNICERCGGTGWYWGCFRISTSRAPNWSCFCVMASRSLPNCENASNSRYWARSSRNVPAIFFMALICAAPPTRETLRPALMAGRTPE